MPPDEIEPFFQNGRKSLKPFDDRQSALTGVGRLEDGRWIYIAMPRAAHPASFSRPPITAYRINVDLHFCSRFRVELDLVEAVIPFNFVEISEI